MPRLPLGALASSTCLLFSTRLGVAAAHPAVLEYFVAASSSLVEHVVHAFLLFLCPLPLNLFLDGVQAPACLCDEGLLPPFKFQKGIDTTTSIGKEPSPARWRRACLEQLGPGI